jgi:Ras-related protein Rab-11A
MDDSEEYEMMIKVILIGDSGVGKTNIMSKFLKNQFLEDSKATVGVEFGSKLFIQQGHKIKAQIWDTAGQEKYKAITSAYYKGSKGALVIYDITQKETFANIEKWVNDLKCKGDPKITIIIIGNKSDLEEKRQISKEQGEEKAKSFGCAFLETSAFSGDNIEKAFEMMVKEIYDKFTSDIGGDDEEELDNNEKGEDLKLEKVNPDNNEKKKCC